MLTRFIRITDSIYSDLTYFVGEIGKEPSWVASRASQGNFPCARFARGMNSCTNATERKQY